MGEHASQVAEARRAEGRAEEGAPDGAEAAARLAERIAALSPNAAIYADATPDERLDTIEQLTGLLAATHAELLDVVAAAEACGDWELDGAVAPAPWLVARLGLARRTADEWVRVSAALQDLP